MYTKEKKQVNTFMIFAKRLVTNVICTINKIRKNNYKNIKKIFTYRKLINKTDGCNLHIINKKLLN